MTTLVCLGFGYSAQHYVTLYGNRFDRIIGTTRSEDTAATLGARQFGGRRTVEMLVFDGTATSPALAAAIADATVLLDSISPHEGADPVLAHLRDALMAAPRLGAIIYLSTIAVYGNHDGRWIDETTPLTPALTRAGDRIDEPHHTLGRARAQNRETARLQTHDRRVGNGAETLGAHLPKNPRLQLQNVRAANDILSLRAAPGQRKLMPQLRRIPRNAVIPRNQRQPA